jgi:protein-L-isoaspartate(D-aspartate) O-methyltransferase
MKKRPGFPVRLDREHEKAPIDTLLSATKVVKLNQSTTQKSSNSNTPLGLGLDSQKVRQRMVDKLELQGLEDEWVLKAMSTIERHRFVDTALVNQAYEDTSLPIGFGQTISKPNVVARMLALLRGGRNLLINGKMGKVLEIGTGCGYQAALLGELSKEVYSIERIKGLYDKAQEHLQALGTKNIHLLFSDGMLGHPQAAPFNAIISAAGGETLPQTWIDQLAVGGRLVAPWAQTQGGQQSLLVIDKNAHGIERQILEPVHFVPLKSGIV